MLSPKTPPVGREAMAYRPGHFVAVYPATRVADKVGQNYLAKGGVGMPRTGYIHVIDVPDTISFKRVRRVVTNAYRVWALPEVNPRRIKKRRRLFRLRPSLVPAAARNRLLADREITVTFTQFKNFVRKLTVVDVDDPTTDTETVALDDADF